MLPEGWNQRKLDDVSELIGGSTPSKAVSDYWDGEIPWATPSDITSLSASANYIYNTSSKITKLALEETSVRLLNPRSVLMTSRATIGEVVINMVPMATNQGFCNFIPNSSINAEYLTNWLKFSKKELKRLAAGSTFLEISKKTLKNIEIDLPPLSEQIKIAAILGSVDDAIQATQAMIDQTRRVKQGLMQQLLTRGIGHTRFKQTEIGEIPEEWEVKPIGQIAKLQAGFAFKGTWATNQGVRWLKIANVSQGNAVWKDESFLPEDFLDEYDDFALQGGDIVVAMTRPVLNGALKVAVLKGEDVPALLNQRVGRLIPRIQEVEKKFLYILMRSSKVSNDIETIISGTDPPNISGKQIENIVVPVPALDEQRHLADIFTSIERKIAQEESCLKELKHVKQGLMQDLLTGRVRVKLDGGATT